MGYLMFVGQQLVKMQAMGLKDILLQDKPVSDSQDGVDPVDHQKEYVSPVVTYKNQFQQQKYQPKSNRYAARITGKTPGFGPEIVKKEYQASQHWQPDHICINERCL